MKTKLLMSAVVLCLGGSAEAGEGGQEASKFSHSQVYTSRQYDNSVVVYQSLSSMIRNGELSAVKRFVEGRCPSLNDVNLAKQLVNNEQGGEIYKIVQEKRGKTSRQFRVVGEVVSNLEPRRGRSKIRVDNEKQKRSFSEEYVEILHKRCERTSYTTLTAMIQHQQVDAVQAYLKKKKGKLLVAELKLAKDLAAQSDDAQKIYSMLDNANKRRVRRFRIR